MADDKKKPKSEKRYGSSPTVKDGKPVKPEKKAEAKAEATAGEGTDGENKTGGAAPDPAANVNTAGVPEHEQAVHIRHTTERKELNGRHDKERMQMHGRHADDHKKIAARHTAELAGMHEQGSSDDAAGKKADATQKDMKTGTEY